MLQGGWGIVSKFPYAYVYLCERDLLEPITVFLPLISKLRDK